MHRRSWTTSHLNKHNSTKAFVVWLPNRSCLCPIPCRLRLDGSISFVRSSPMAPSPSSMKPGRCASVWQANMFGPRSLPIADVWRFGINVPLNLIGTYSKTVCMRFPKPWRGSDRNVLMLTDLKSVHDVLNPPRDKTHADNCSRCLGPLQLAVGFGGFSNEHLLENSLLPVCD